MRPNPFRKLTLEEQHDAVRAVAKIQQEGLLDPVVVFNPSGFDFSIEYFGKVGRTVPIPEFRVYAQQYLTLLAIILMSYREILSESTVRLRTEVESADDNLSLVLYVDISLFGSGETQPLHVIGSSLSSGLRHIFPDLAESIFWDWQAKTAYGKFWLKYPGAMTAYGFARTMNQAYSFGWKAQLDIPYPSNEQYRRAIALRDFVLCEPATEL
jgi:hypothetical protein